MRDALRWHVEGIVDPHARIDAARAPATAARAHAVRRGAGGESSSAPPAADSLLYHDALAETNAFPVDHRVRRACGDSGPALPLRRGAPRRPPGDLTNVALADRPDCGRPTDAMLRL